MRTRSWNRSSCASGSEYVPSYSTGLAVAITRKGSASGRVSPSTVTCDSAIASSSAAWVFGGVRLISSASSRCVKTGPGWNTISPERWSYSGVPVTSEGNRSGVNWIRRKSRPRVVAKDRARSVLPSPGRSSTRT